MPVNMLDHVNVRSQDPQSTLAFFREALLMKTGAPPGIDPKMVGKGGWVYDSNDLAILHVADASVAYPTDTGRPFTPAMGSGAVHHVALACTDFEGIRERLQSLDIAFTENDVSQFSLRQLFVEDPNGILFELNFRG